MGYNQSSVAELGVTRSIINVNTATTTNFSSPPRRIYVGTGGTLNVTGAADTTPVLIFNFPSGSYLDASIKQISNVNATATNIVAFI